MSKKIYVMALAGLFAALTEVGALGRPVDGTGTPELVRVQNVQPFTHVASVPANTDPATIRFERIKETRLPTQIKYTTDASICPNLSEPGGSRYCPNEEAQAYVDAYDVTYSFSGRQDEFDNPDSTFHVYLRPEEIPAQLKDALAGHKLNRSKSAEYFKISLLRDPVGRWVVDDEKSSVCATSFGPDGWTKTDYRCQDKISLKKVMAPAESISVRVDATPISAVQAENRSGK